MNHYRTILYQALASRVGLLVQHEDRRSAIQQFRTQRKSDPALSLLRFFPSPTDPCGILIVKDPSRDKGKTPTSGGEDPGAPL